MSIAKAKTRLPSEIFDRKSVNAFTQRKLHSIRDYQAKPSEKRCSERPECLYKTETSLAKAKTLLPSENVALKGEKTFLPCETVTRKGENALTERKRRTNRRNRVYGAKMSLAKAFTERNRGSL